MKTWRLKNSTSIPKIYPCWGNMNDKTKSKSNKSKNLNLASTNLKTDWTNWNRISLASWRKITNFIKRTNNLQLDLPPSKKKFLKTWQKWLTRKFSLIWKINSPSWKNKLDSPTNWKNKIKFSKANAWLLKIELTSTWWSSTKPKVN